MGFFQSLFHNSHNNTKVSSDSKQLPDTETKTPTNTPPTSPSNNNNERTPIHALKASALAVFPASTPRFELHEDGTHAHHLTIPVPNRLASSFNGLVGGLFRFDSAKSMRKPWSDKKASALYLQEEHAALNHAMGRAPTDATLVQKWGTCQEVVGRGANGVVRIVHKTTSDAPDSVEQLYAVKEFQRKNSESTKDYVQRVMTEYELSSALQQRNIIHTFDLVPLSDTSPNYCQVMEYVNGGDLFNLIYESADGIERDEADCFFKQLMSGVHHMHSMGIAHRDLKPENLLLTADGCLKISDFGSAMRFVIQQDDGETVLQYSKGRVGSEPYMAPEEFTEDSYDACKIDVWSCGIIYMAMRTGKHLWQVAKEGQDSDFDRFLKFRRIVGTESKRARLERKVMHAVRDDMTDEEKVQVLEKSAREREEGLHKVREIIRQKSKQGGYDILEGVEFGAKKLVYRMLDPNPSKRVDTACIIRNDWFVSIVSCQQF